PVLGDGGRAGEVRLDHVDEPGLGRGDAVSVEEPLEIGYQETMFTGQLRDAAVHGVQALSQGDRRQPRQAQLAPPHVVVAVARVVDGVEDDAGAERLDPLCDLVKPAQDRARALAAEQVVATGGERDDVRRCWCPSEVGEYALCRVPVAGEVDEIDTELAGELRRRSSTGYAGVVVDGDAAPQGEIDAHRDGCIVAKGGSGPAVGPVRSSSEASLRGTPPRSASRSNAFRRVARRQRRGGVRFRGMF